MSNAHYVVIRETCVFACGKESLNSNGKITTTSMCVGVHRVTIASASTFGFYYK